MNWSAISKYIFEVAWETGDKFGIQLQVGSELFREDLQSQSSEYFKTAQHPKKTKKIADKGYAIFRDYLCESIQFG
jgi:hypothetical protein